MAIEWTMLTPELKLSRVADGRVIVRIGGEQTYVSADKWAGVVASLCAKGRTDDTLRAATALHGGIGKTAP